MSKSYLPSKEADLVTWTGTFSAKLSATPLVFSLTPAQATAYETVQKDWATAYATYQDPATKTKPNLQIKRAAKTAVTEMTRELARIVQASPTVSDSARAELGLPVHKTEPTPIGIPDVAPKVDIVDVYGSTVTGRIHNPTTGKKTRPAGCANAVIFSHVGPTASENPDDYKWQGTVTRSNFSVTFPGDLAPGTKVWIVAAYQNPKGEAGPGSTPVSALIAGGSMSKMAA